MKNTAVMVTLSARARGSLNEVRRYIAKAGYPQTGLRFTKMLARYALDLGPVAESIHVSYVSSQTGHAYRSVPHREYRIVYTVQGERVIIVDFFHGARSQRSLEYLKP